MVLDFVPGGKAMKAFKGAAAKLGIKKVEQQLLKEARKAAKRAKNNKNFTKQAGKKIKKPVRQTESYIPAPRTPQDMPAFPDLIKVKRKTLQGSGKLRKRWEDKKGNIYEWDYQHGTLEKYNKRGNHLGEFDKNTGKQIKGPDLTRNIEP